MLPAARPIPASKTKQGAFMQKIIGLTALVLAGALGFAPAALADAASETVTAGSHVDLGLAAPDLKGLRTHLHHALNCLVGPDGYGFDAKALNPCAQSGKGAIPDSADAAKKAKLQSAANRIREGISSSDLTTARKAASEAAAQLKTAQ
jgi:hypothetical protein